MAADDFGSIHSGNPRYVLKIESKLIVVANWNLNQWRLDFDLTLK